MPTLHYDAFISYRHGERDGLVAERLHKLLETYRIPAAIAKRTGKKRIERVFRDREELPTSSDLSNSINQALANSDFLILICSKRTCQSIWVMREVELFSELHGKDRIVALLIDGEPDESFPEMIRYGERDDEIVPIEPLAADIRAKTDKESLKILKDEKLRLLAPILGCAYDELKQRHRERRIKRILTSVSCVFAGILAFGSFSFYQYLQIQKQMTEKLRQQSYVLCEYSADVLKSGDPITAAMLAVEALPKNLKNPDRPYVPSAQKALADALRYYNIDDGFDYHRVVTGTSAPKNVIISPEGGYTAVVYTSQLNLFDNQTGDMIVSLPLYSDVLSSADFVRENVVVFAGENGLCEYDIITGETLYLGDKIITDVAVSGDKNLIASMSYSSDEIYIHDANGNSISTLTANGKTRISPIDGQFQDPHNDLFYLNHDGSKLAVSFDDGSLQIFSTNSDASVDVEQMSDISHYSGFFVGEYFIYATVTPSPYLAELVIYDTTAQAEIGRFNSNSYNFVIARDEDENADKNGFYYANGGNLIYVDLQGDGYRTVVTAFSSEIEALSIYGGVCLITCEDGSYHFYDKNTAQVFTNSDGYTYGMPASGQLTSFKADYICQYPHLRSQFAVVGSRDSYSSIILKYEEHSDKNLLENDPNMSYIDAGRTADNQYIVRYSYEGFSTYGNNGELITQVAFPNAADVMNIEFDAQSGNVAAISLTSLTIYDSQSGSVLFEVADCKSVFNSRDGFFHCVKDNTVQKIDITSANVTQSDTVSEKYATVTNDKTLSDNDEILAIYAEYIVVARSGFIEVNRENGGVYKQLFAVEMMDKCDANFICDGKYLAIIPYNGIPTIYDMKKGEKAFTLEQDGYIADIYTHNDYILADVISTNLARYSLILDEETFEPVASVPGLCDISADGELLIRDSKGNLRVHTLHSYEKLTKEADVLLDGRSFTQSQLREFHIG